MRGLSSWILSHVKPIRSSAPGAKFSTSTSQCLTNRSSSSLPCGFLASIVIERLLWFSIVKYSESTSGMSRSCPRVGSPSPGRSTLITSAPSQASSCVQVGPDCTCVKSRIRTPSNALPITRASAHSPGAASPPSNLLVHGLCFGAGGVLARVDPDVDHGAAAALGQGLARPPQGRRNLGRLAHFLTVPAQHLGKLAKGHIAQQIAHVAAALAVLRPLPVADLVHGRVVADHRDVRSAEPVGRLHVKGRHAEGA